MAITLTRVFGPVALPSGEVPAHGRIRFTLRGWDVDGDSVVPGATIEATLDAAGNLDTMLWASLSGAQQLAYGVEVTWWSPVLRALARQSLPDIAVPAGADVKLKDLLSIPLPATSSPDILAQAAGYAAAAEAAATSATGLSQQAIDILALGAPGVFADTASGIAATAVGEFFSVATAADDSFLILYRHDAGGIATEIARYPSTATLGAGGGGGDGGSAVRIAPEGEAARLDFALGAGRLRGGAGDATGAPAALGSFRALDAPRLYRRQDGRFGLTPADELRREWAIEGFAGALFEPAATVFAPLAPIGTAAGWTTIGVTLADDAKLSPVEGAPARLLSASAGGSADRGIGIAGVPLTLEWHQVDVILRTGAATAVMLRLASEFGNPAFGGGGWAVHINLATGTILRNDVAGQVTAAPVFLREIAPGVWHIRIRALPATVSATEDFWIYAKSSDDLLRASTFNAGDGLFTLVAFSVQRCAAPRAPAAPAGMDIAVPAEQLTLDVSGISGDRATGTFEVHFRLADDFPEDETTITPVWKIAAAGDPANRGFGIEIVGRTVAAVLGVDAVPSTLGLRDLFAREVRAAFSYDGAALRVAINGATIEVDVGAIDLPSQWESLFFGEYNAIRTGTARPFSGTIGFWRYHPEAFDVGTLARLTRAPRAIAPAEIAPAFLDSVGGVVLGVDGAGRLDFAPGPRAVRSQIDAIDPDGMLPADALGARLMDNGDVAFLSSGYAEPFGDGLQRAVMLKGEHGLIVGNRARRFEAMWGNGQSLMFANTYGLPVNWPDHPWFLDVDDGDNNSVFGFSSVGNPTDRLTYPRISQDPVGGAGGILYPTAHALARLDAAGLAAPPPLIAKSIGQSGERINNLWPWGVFEADGVTPMPGENPQHWINVRKWHQSVVDSVTRLGGTVSMPALVWAHGTADSTNPDYYDEMLLSRADLDAITTEFFGPFGQEAPPLWVMTQSGGRVDTSNNPWPLKMDQLRFAEDQPGAVLAASFAAPDITIAVSDQNVHPDYASSTRIGEIIAHAISEVRAGRRWTIGQPAITLVGSDVILDYAAWLRPGERLVVAADSFYGGVGIGAGAGFEIAQVVDTGTVGVARWGGPAANVLGIAVEPSGTAFRVTLDAPPAGPQGYEMRYAHQIQDMFVADPLHYAHRGLLRTDWGMPSAILPGERLRRWLPSWKQEVLN